MKGAATSVIVTMVLGIVLAFWAYGQWFPSEKALAPSVTTEPTQQDRPVEWEPPRDPPDWQARIDPDFDPPLRALSSLSARRETLFPSAVYGEFNRSGQVDGRRLGRPGVVFSREEFCATAIARFEQAARHAGVSDMRAVTRAIIEGRFVPAWEDIKLVFESLVPDDSLTAEYISPGYLENLGLTRNYGPNGELPDVRYFTLTYKKYRDAAWNERFGSINDLDYVRTLILSPEIEENGSFVPVEATLSRMDLGVRLLQHMQPDRLQKEYGIDTSPNESYDNIMDKLTDRPFLQQRLKREINRELDTTSVYFFFIAYKVAEPHPLDHARIYQCLRETYLEREP